MAVQFSLSYDANGDPVLVENTVTGTRKVVSTSPVVSEFKSRFETPGDNIPDEEEDIVDSPIYDYINEMESGAANDINLSFIEKQNLERYTPEAISKREAPLTKLQSLFQSALKTVLPGDIKAGIALVNVISKFLPKESPEIKAIKQHYATPEMANLVESIPGMSNYNLVYGNPFNPSYGLANAAQKRINTINKTLQRQIDKGLDPSQTLIERKKKLQELIEKENKGIDEQLGVKVEDTISSMPSGMGDIGSGGGGQDSGNQGGSSPTGTNRPGGPSRPDDVGSGGSTSSTPQRDYSTHKAYGL